MSLQDVLRRWKTIILKAGEHQIILNNEAQKRKQCNPLKKDRDFSIHIFHGSSGPHPQIPKRSLARGRALLRPEVSKEDTQGSSLIVMPTALGVWGHLPITLPAPRCDQITSVLQANHTSRSQGTPHLEHISLSTSKWRCPEARASSPPAP